MIALALALLLVQEPPSPSIRLPSALAGFGTQDTGGSMGGSDFGSSSDSGGGGSSSSSDYSSSDYGSGGSSGGGSGEPLTARQCGCIMVGLGFIVLFWFLWASARGSLAQSANRTWTATHAEMYLSTLAIGVDWHARPALQKRLAELAAQGLGATPDGRARMLHETVLALQRAELSWLYGRADDARGLSRGEAESQFHAARNAARARFKREVIRSEGADVRREDAAVPAPRPSEGPGTVVVTLVLVTRRALAGTAGSPDAASMRAALADRAALRADELVAIEVVWSPAAEDDRMSSAELAQHYPELVKLDEKTIAGRVACAYCGCLFAMELINCPNCGAIVKA